MSVEHFTRIWSQHLPEFRITKVRYSNFDKSVDKLLSYRNEILRKAGRLKYQLRNSG